MLDNNKIRMEWVQVLRGIAAIMVVFCHLGLMEIKTFAAGSRFIPHFLTFVGPAGVDVFFLISGFIMVFITPEKIGTLSAWLLFLYRRCTRIFPPYWIVSGVLLMVWLQRPDLFNHWYHNQVDLSRSFLLIPQHFTPLLGVGWSLIHEIYFYFVVSFIFLFLQSGRIILLASWFIFLLGANLSGFAESFSDSPVMSVILSPFSMEFQLGMLVALSYRQLSRLRLSGWFCATAAVCSLGLLYGIGGFMPDAGVYPDNNHLCRVAIFGVPAFMLLAFVVQMDAAATFSPPRWAVLVGDSSYAIYLLHFPLITGMYKLFAWVVPHPGFVAAWGAVIVFLGVILSVSIWFHVWLERRFISFFHRITPFGKSRGGAKTT